MDGTKEKHESRAAKWRASLHSDPVRLEQYRAKTRAAAKARYHALKSDPEFIAKERQRKRELQRSRYANPETKAIITAQNATYRAKPELKAKKAVAMAAWRAANKGAIKEYQAHWKKENAETVRGYLKEYSRDYRERPEVKQINRAKHLSKNYGISMADFVAMWDAQNGKCAVCEIEMLPTGRTADAACVDHNHVTGDVRGLLCRSCNHGIGHLKDSPEILELAAAYLRLRGHYGKHKSGKLR